MSGASGGKAGHGGGGKKKHHDDDHGEEHPDERWLVTYADMVTLLMVLFIVLFAMSTVDVEKYKALKDSLAIGFGQNNSILNGQSPMSNSKGAADPGEDAQSMQQLMATVPDEQKATITKIVQENDRLRRGRQMGDAEAEVNRLLEAWLKIDRALKAKGMREDVRVTVDERGLVVSLVSQHIVFAPDIASLTPLGQRVVDTLAPVLKSLPEPLEIDGHTNQEKVKPAFYPTDWELSLARAATVLRRLEEVHRIPARRLRATGFGHTKPLIDPKKPGSQEINKRVDIIVLSQQPAETRALLGEAYAELQRQAVFAGERATAARAATPATPARTGDTTPNPTAESRRTTP
ncbi:flagellar motor protein MotB [Nocardioides sp.]|uniref:OmpA/MotB family protein n=1 Tax=Nocardioides sp. TaxID=35761 RepID=UPI003510F366